MNDSSAEEPGEGQLIEQLRSQSSSVVRLFMLEVRCFYSQPFSPPKATLFPSYGRPCQFLPACQVDSSPGMVECAKKDASLTIVVPGAQKAHGELRTGWWRTSHLKVLPAVMDSFQIDGEIRIHYTVMVSCTMQPAVNQHHGVHFNTRRTDRCT